jgi:hypothetical protein
MYMHIGSLVALKARAPWNPGVGEGRREEGWMDGNEGNYADMKLIITRTAVLLAVYKGINHITSTRPP